MTYGINQLVGLAKDAFVTNAKDFADLSKYDIQGHAQSFASIMKELPIKATSYVHAACDELTLRHYKRLHDAAVNNLNVAGRDRLENLERGSTAYNETAARQHDVFSGTIQNMEEAENYIVETCHDHVTSQLSERAQDIVTIPEYGALTLGILALGMAAPMVLYRAREQVYQGAKNLTDKFKNLLHRKPEDRSK